MKRILCTLSATLVCSAAFGSINYSGGTYTQDFDSLPTTLTTNPWSNNSTLAGWYALQANGGTTPALRSGRAVGTWNTIATIRAGDGSSNTGALYSFGTGTSTDRALGSIGSGTPSDFIYALVLRNTTGAPMSSFTLSYDGEQWRNGGNTDSARHMLDFDYAVMAAAPTNADLQGGNLTGYSGFEPTVWTTDSSTSLDKTAGTIPTGTSALATPGTLDFEGPIGTTTAAAVNGNVAGLVSGINGTVSVNWGVNEYLVLRWWDNDSVGNDHALAIDNVSFSAVPEPTTLALLGLGALIAGRRRRS